MRRLSPIVSHATSSWRRILIRNISKPSRATSAAYTAIAGAMNTAESRRPLGENQEELLAECLRPVPRLYIASNVCALACVVKIYVSYLLLQHSVS